MLYNLCGIPSLFKGQSGEKMVEKNFLDVIKRITKQLNNRNIQWALTGSTNFALQGLPIIPNDIDIQTDKDGAYEIENIFKAYSNKSVEYSSNGLIRSHFGSLIIEEISVEIMGDLEKLVEGKWEKPPDLNKIIEILCIEDINLPVLALAYEAEAYMKLGRTSKANILYKHIKQHQ